jgi:hypothetical protein
MEALERAGIELTPCAIEAVSIDEIDPATFIIGRNIRRRHLTKQQQADLIVAACKAAEAEDDRVSRQVGGKSGRPANEIKAKAVGEAKKFGIASATVERSMAKVNPTPKVNAGRKRRNNAEPERDHLLGGFTGVVLGIRDLAFTGAALDLLSEDVLAYLTEEVEKAMASLGTLLDQLRLRLKNQV